MTHHVDAIPPEDEFITVERDDCSLVGSFVHLQ